MRDWWDEDTKTKNHARFCQPLRMANQLGFYIVSPATFTVTWDGDLEHDSHIEILETSSHTTISNHSAHGSFTIQPDFIPITEKGDFIYIKNVPNLRQPYNVMEGLIEAWWSPAHFGIVLLCNQAGQFTIKKGEPIAQMLVLNDADLDLRLEVTGTHEAILHRQEWLEKREQQTGVVLDYLKGLYPNGTAVDLHYRSAKKEVVDYTDADAQVNFFRQLLENHKKGASSE